MNDSCEPSLHLKLFGMATITLNGQPVRLALKRAYALLAFLALEARAAPRDYLAPLLWPEADLATARTRLRRLVYRIEEVCHGDLFESHEGGLSLVANALSCDTVEFRDAARSFVGRGAPSRPFVELTRLTPLACEPLLEGISIGSDAFDDWVRAQRLEHERLLARTLTRLAEVQRGHGELDDAVDTVERLLRVDPCCEPAYVQRMSLAAAMRDATGVEAAFMRCADTLRHEFGCKPSPATEQAYLELRQRAELPSEGLFPSSRDEAARLDIRFAASPAGTVAYATLGRGSEVVVVMPGFVSHIEIAWEHTRIRQLLNRLAEHFTVVVFDRRGMGLSERLDPAGTIQAAAGDVQAILDAAGIHRAWLFGSSEGGLAAIQLAALCASRVGGLILFGSMAKGSRAEDYPWALPRDAYDRWMERLVGAWGGPADIETFSPSEQNDPSVRAWWARMLRHAVSPGSLRAVLAGLRDADVRPLLQQVWQPTLVLHRRGDRAVRFEAGEHLAANIRGARFVALDGTSHWWWADDADRVIEALSAFIEATPTPA